MKAVVTSLLLPIAVAVALPVAAQDPEAQPATAPAEQSQTQTAPDVQPQAEPPATPTAAPVIVPTTFFEKLRVVVDGRADVSGVIQLKFQPSGGEPKLISVNVLAKMKAKAIARDIWKELSLAAGSPYKVRLDNKVVEIKRTNRKSPNFALIILSQSATGVSVSTKR